MILNPIDHVHDQDRLYETNSFESTLIESYPQFLGTENTEAVRITNHSPVKADEKKFLAIVKEIFPNAKINYDDSY